MLYKNHRDLGISYKSSINYLTGIMKSFLKLNLVCVIFYANFSLE